MKKDRVILHSDLNNFYASVESFFNPELEKVPMAVAGSQEHRQGVILAKNQLAKKYGIITGESTSMALRKCPDLILVPPNFENYIKYSEKVRKVYTKYTDQVESFGIDECWLDVTGSRLLFGSGMEIAEKIRKEVKEEIGLTVSIGVSFNKIFAKLGSDYKKPDAITLIEKENYKDIIWNLPVRKLLYVGKKMNMELNEFGINTIGDLAKSNAAFLESHFGKWGKVLYSYANGDDDDDVKNIKDNPNIKSIGNSTTTSVDLKNLSEIKPTIYMLADSVATRLRKMNLKCNTIQISFKTNDFKTMTRQKAILAPTYVSKVIADEAMELFKTKYDFSKPLRLIGIKVTNLVPDDEVSQLNIFNDIEDIKKAENIEIVVDGIRDKFGYQSIQKGTVMTEANLNIKKPNENHLSHPNNYSK